VHRHPSGVAALAHLVRTDRELRREAFSMSLYVSIVLFSALAVFDDGHPPDNGEVFLVELGTTVGLVLAHGFASWVSTRLIGGDEEDEDVDPWDLLRVQLAGAMAVALIAMLAVVIAPTSVELQAARLAVAVTIGAEVFLESRTTHTTGRAFVYGVLALLLGVGVATIKAALSH
jgi:hypothetical protein